MISYDFVGEPLCGLPFFLLVVVKNTQKYLEIEQKTGYNMDEQRIPLLKSILEG